VQSYKKFLIFPTFPHKKFFNNFINILSTKSAFLQSTDYQRLRKVVNKRGKSGAKTHLFDFFRFFLRMSEKSSNFAPDFEEEV